MQRVIEFKSTSFWTSRPDLDKLNEKIFQLNRDGWKILSITPNAGFSGIVRSYTIFMEMPE